MSGHSKWSTIKRKKGAADAARGKIFSRLVKEITVASRTGGGDADSNPRLRTAIDTARRENMPAANIDRAIKRGTGEIPGMQFEEVTYEGYGPGGVAILVQAATDNRNRTIAEVRKIFEKAGGNMGEPNTVAWMFNHVGYFLLDSASVDEDELMGVVLDAGADDLTLQDGMYEVLSPPTAFHAVRTALQSAGFECTTGELAMLPQNYLAVSDKDAERCLKLMSTLEDQDDVQNVWANVDLDQETIERVATG